MISRILIANRGEIALRVIAACRELGIPCVTVYTEADREGRWIEKADHAVKLKGFSARDGYLNIEAILHAAKESKADAIHPGYGFLSEAPEFSEACRKNKITFIGPNPKAMKTAGDKVEARRLARSLGIPILSGTEPLRNLSDAKRGAGKLGFPLILKAAAGGGGRGMRLVNSLEDLTAMFESASREALASFGDGTLYLEKFLLKPRHVEIQVLIDAHGNGIYLGERECSIQRRYQKLIEESPSPAVDPKLRATLGQASVNLLREAGYTNAGTVEFLLDENHNYYFMEVNARLQVEHPITEMVTGIDLVAAQIQIAAGEKLPWNQNDIRLSGWAIEARINCEDPLRDFLPSPGRITRLEFPHGPFTRVDSSIYNDYEIPSEFDSLIAKLVTWGETRARAIARIERALAEMKIGGIPTTIPFLQNVFRHRDFKKGNLSTAFIPDRSKMLIPKPSRDELNAAAVAAAMSGQSPILLAPQNGYNKWNQAAKLENVKAFP